MANIILVKTHIKAKIMQGFKQLDFGGIIISMNQTLKSQQYVPTD